MDCYQNDNQVRKIHRKSNAILLDIICSRAQQSQNKKESQNHNNSLRGDWVIAPSVTQGLSPIVFLKQTDLYGVHDLGLLTFYSSWE